MQEEPKEELHICKYCNAQTTQPDDKCYAKPKQETLEEAAKIYAKIPIVKSVDEEERYYNSACKLYDAFKAGANWQAETVYSEGDLREAFRQGQDNVKYSEMYGFDYKLTEQDWFSQFKKK
jgi:hypothetical protein